MERWTGGFQAGAQVLADPRYMCSSSSILPAEVYLAYEDSEIQQLLEVPQDESHLPDLLGIASTPTSDHDMTIHVHVPPKIEQVPYTALPEQEEAPATIALGSVTGGSEEDDRREGRGSTWLLPRYRRRRPPPAVTPRKEGGCTSSIADRLAYMSKSGSGPRRPRQKRNCWPVPEDLVKEICFQDLCSASKSKKDEQDFCSASKSKKDEHQPKNHHWEPEEVKLLVKGLSEFGFGQWTKLKGKWFSNSDRTAVNLKDKWRNLENAFVSKPNAKKKVNNAHLDKDLINKIKMLSKKTKNKIKMLADSNKK